MKKEILKEIREPGKSRKKKGQPKGRRNGFLEGLTGCLLYTSPSPRDRTRSRMPSSA